MHLFSYEETVMLRTNVDRLVKISVVGEVASPVYGKGIYRISAEGIPGVLPGVAREVQIKHLPFYSN